MTDYKDEIIKNIFENMNKNSFNKFYKVKENGKDKLKARVNVYNLDWMHQHVDNEKFDVIIGSDLIYEGSPVQELYDVIKSYLNEDGKCYLMVPNNR